MEQRAYIFGGHSSSTANIEVAFTDVVVPGATSGWSVSGAVSVGLVHDGSDWTSRVELTMAHQCEDDCFAQDLVLSVGSVLEAELETLTATIEYADDPGTTWEGSPYRTEIGSSDAAATFRLPRILSDGDDLTVVASMGREVDTSGSGDVFGCWQQDDPNWGLCHFT